MLHKNETKKVKADLKSISEQINVHSKEMTEKDTACRKEKDQLTETIQSLKETDIRYENTLRDIRKEKEEHNISFSARLETSIPDINPWDTVKFDQVASNNGNYYNAATGIFTAPLAGTYYFSSTIFTKWGSIVEMSLKVNEQTEMWMYACSTTLPGNTATNSVIVKLNKNDTVRITKLAAYGSRPFYIHQVWSTFTGFFIR